ncbi:MAG: Ig-like domain-containing protein [Clostridia bacterium]|nr:Ig-like domain-containing protein [Clostridia bacterium]
MVITEITDKGFSIAQANGSNNNEYSRYKQNYVGTFTYTWSSYVNSTYGARGINYIKLPKDYPYNTTTKPATPTGVSHSDVTASSVTLSWKAAAGAKTYRIDRRPAGDNTSYSTIASGITGTSYTDTKNLSAGTLYWYRVYAVNGSETSDKPDQAHGVYTKIPAPTVKQTDNTSSMTVSWKHITGTGSYILLRRRYDENDYTEIKSDITSTSYTDTKNIVSGFKYYYRIKAVSSDGSAKSGASETGGSFSRTAAPSVTVASQNALNISWSVIKGNNTYQYAIQRSENGSDFYEVGRTAGTSYTDTGLTAGSKYYYRIHAMTTDGNWCMTSQTGSGTTSTGHVLGDNFKARITYASNGMNVTKDDDDNVTVRSYNGSNNQIWQFIKLADSSYQIKSVTDGKLLDVYGYGTEKGTNVFACEDNGTYSTNQRWYISLYNGMYRLKPACSECMLDVTGGGNVAEGTNVQIYTWLADGAQDFYINQIYDSESPTINNFQVTNINSNSFKIECDLNDNIGVTGVNVKIYGRGTDHWLNLPATNGHFSYDINTKDFEGPGTYEVSLSAYDQDGNTGESHYDESRFVNAIDFDSIIAQKTEIYNGHIYQLYYVDGMTWNGAARFASTYGGHLVTVANAEENEFVRSLIPNGKVSCIGASDWTEEGIWKWIVTGETFNYANWDVNEPNNFDNKETVAIMGDNGFWYDTTDSYADDNLLFIIEYEPMIETELEYNGNKYQLFNAAPSWSIAKEYCEMLGGHLATVSNADENKAISNNLIKNKSYYLGATDAKNEGVWEWVTNESFEYAYWNEGEPNNEYNNENVLEIGYLGKWYDISDHLYVNDIRGFICEFEKKQIESISLDTQDKELAIGEEFKLTASVYPEDIESEVLVWTSSNPAVAEVSTDGSVKAVGYGSTAIKAADGTGTVFDICTITVPESMQEPEVAVESISIDKEHIELEEGELEQLIATLMPENASNKTVIWTSSDKSVAEVDEDGFVFGISRGTATITGTVADGGHSVSCEVTVIDATSVIIDDPSDEDSIIISADSMRANAGDTVDIKLSISNNRGFSSLGIEVDYDSDVMELINAVDGGVGASFTTAQYFTAKPYNMQWDSANNINFNGVLAILTFRMKDNIKDGVYPVSISSYKGKNGDYVDGADINYNEDFEPISIVYYEGAVTVSSRMSGDVNGDNKVNNKDATCLLRYLAGWEQTGIVTEALDIDASGKINSKDATVLLRYIAGWDVVLN